MISTPDWTGAACLELDPELFFPKNRWQTRAAKKVCATCPLKQVCLDDAIATTDQWAIRGGTTAEERGTTMLPRATDTHCKRGHVWEGNTYRKPDGYRECRACKRDRSGVDNRRRREATLAGR